MTDWREFMGQSCICGCLLNNAPECDSEYGCAHGRGCPPAEPAPQPRTYQEFYATDCGNCWLMDQGSDRPYYCNKQGCTEPEEEEEGPPIMGPLTEFEAYLFNKYEP